VQDYWDRIIGTETTVKSVITFYINTLLPTQQWLILAPDRPCTQHVQSTRRMSLTVKASVNQGVAIPDWQPVQPQAVTLQLASAVASVRAMVKQGGSETAENDGSKLLNVARPQC
jgi:hypothetical protein